MGKARFEVGITCRQAAGEDWADVGPTGRDQVEFLLSPNSGEPLKPLVKIVSGGEMSRIMLAIKVVLARVDGVPTLIFDEIDAGISGRAAQAVSEKLSLLSAESQVLCVTHLPQIAAMADDHFLISKEEEDGRTTTRVLSLDDKGRILEIARMIGGSDLTRLTLDHASEMVSRAHATREALRSGRRAQSEAAATEIDR
jgi:DNA repair protein RecN (Recombination protein N)